MFYCKRFLAALTSLIGVAGLLISLGVGVGTWFLAATTTAKVNLVFARMEAGLDRADHGLTEVWTALDRAAERLESTAKSKRN